MKENVIISGCAHCGETGSCSCDYCQKNAYGDAHQAGRKAPCAKCDGTGKRVINH